VSILVKLLYDHIDSAGSFIIEVEDPDYARDDEDRKLRIILHQTLEIKY